MWDKLGSSPRARGAVPCNYIIPNLQGIIPARAGSSSGSASPACAPRDHPRARGEQGWKMSEAQEQKGSSPRARGAVMLQPADFCKVRIIPARAGSSQCLAVADGSVVGSSPRARGAGTWNRSARRLPRIIPARAGSSDQLAL